MKGKHTEISYTFEELETGGRVRIRATSAEALKAIHDFLRFQIEDHHTGDTTDIGSLLQGSRAVRLNRLLANAVVRAA